MIGGRLFVSTGDPAGVGPEVAVEAAEEMAGRRRVVLLGDARRLRERVSTPLLAEEDDAPTGLSVVDTGAVSDDVVEARAATPEGGRAQLAALDAAIDRALAHGGAVVTAPTSKAAIERSGTPFSGQTEHLARRAGLAPDAVTMMFLGPRLNVALATTHLSMRRVPDAITVARVERAIAHVLDALGRLAIARLDTATPGAATPGAATPGAATPGAAAPGAVAHGADADSPRVLVAALNPHAGEGGLFGTEDAEAILPAVERARSAAPSARIEGPIGAETAFRRAASGDADAVVAMYHDQATIASKLLDWGEAVNVTWGLPFVRTSVDHGVAYDAAAAGTASAEGMRAALALAAKLTERE